MKNLLSILLLLGFYLCSAQNEIKSEDILEVKYHQFMDFDVAEKVKSRPSGVSIAEYESALIEAMEKPRYFILSIKGSESDFHESFVIENSQPKEKDAVDIRFGTNTKENHKYKNTETKEYLEESDLDGKKYLIKDTLRDYPWKIENNEKSVCNIQTRKATFFNEKDSLLITAWYAPKLNYKHGPENFWGLPGVILELHIELKKKNYSSLTEIRYECTSVNAITVDKEKSIRPKKGEIISNEEFWEKIREHQKKFDEIHSDGVDKD